MPYTAEISRANPGCIIFLIDQSGSMNEQLEYGSKAEQVASILNRTLQELITRCSREEGVRDYFEVGVIGYQGDRPKNALAGELSQRLLHPISSIEANPARIEDRVRKISDGAGGLVEVPTKFQVWLSPESSGGTPMCEALALVSEVLVDWCDNHPSAFPPVVIHLTDGMSTDGDPESAATLLRQIRTDDGEVILMNIHVSGIASQAVAFPNAEDGLGDAFAKLLFRMSSPLVESMHDTARQSGFEIRENARAFMFNAKTEEIVKFFDIGSRPSNLR